jgi:hypothetical protein
MKPAPFVDSGDYPTCQAKALAFVDYDGFQARQAEARKQGRYIGIGIGNAVEATGLGPYESATARVSTSGKITIYTGATPQGQSHKTTLAEPAQSARHQGRRRRRHDPGHRHADVGGRRRTGTVRGENIRSADLGAAHRRTLGRRGQGANAVSVERPGAARRRGAENGWEFSV